MEERKHILLTGASGYLGQHLLSHWMKNGPPSGDQHYHITALYNSLEGFESAVDETSCHPKVTVSACTYDLTNPSSSLPSTDFDVCVHTAALSSPRACENDPDKAQSINVPRHFFQAVSQVPMIAMSTDQVYDGSKDVETEGFYEEKEEPNPLNVYSKNKLEMEALLQQTANAGCVALRSSIILGPNAPFGKAHDTFLHFCASRQDLETTFFTNEYRTVVSVDHVCHVVDWLVSKCPKWSALGYQCYNLGGPNRVNRLDMARAVFEHFGYDPKVLLPAKQTSPTSPLDISMNCTKLQDLTSIRHGQSTVAELVAYTFQ